MPQLPFPIFKKLAFPLLELGKMFKSEQTSILSTAGRTTVRYVPPQHNLALGEVDFAQVQPLSIHFFDELLVVISRRPNLEFRISTEMRGDESQTCSVRTVVVVR